MRHRGCLQRNALKSRSIICPLSRGYTPEIPRPNAHGLALPVARRNISVTLIIVLRAALEDEADATGQNHSTRTLMILDPAAAIVHAVDVNAEATLQTQVDPDPALLRGVAVRTVTAKRVVQRLPAVPFSSNEESDMVGQFLR